MSIDPREIARELIENASADVEYLSIGEWLEGVEGADALPSDEWDALQRSIDDLIDKAIVTVTLPGDPVCPACGNLGADAETGSEPS